MNPPKFRIVKRTKAKNLYVFGSVVYVAQRKLLDLFWVDCRFFDSEDLYHTYAEELVVVEKYIQKQLYNYQPTKDEVVRTFYDDNKDRIGYKDNV